MFQLSKKHLSNKSMVHFFEMIGFRNPIFSLLHLIVWSLNLDKSLNFICPEYDITDHGLSATLNHKHGSSINAISASQIAIEKT